MEKEWCTYSYMSRTIPEYVGRVIREYRNTLEVLYSESQLCSPECWDPNHITRFGSLEEAMEYLLANKLDDYEWTDEQYWDYVKYCFPSYFKKEAGNYGN